MNPQERKIIDNLFDKLGHAELQASPREPVPRLTSARTSITSLPRLT